MTRAGQDVGGSRDPHLRVHHLGQPYHGCRPPLPSQLRKDRIFHAAQNRSVVGDEDET